MRATIVALAVLDFIAVGAAFDEERRMLRGPAAAQYRAYRRHVGLLLPRF